MELKTAVFRTADDHHLCLEVRTPESLSRVVAYVDLLLDGTYAITTFDIYGCRPQVRNVSRKTLKGAQSVLDRHLSSNCADPVDITGAVLLG